MKMPILPRSWQRLVPWAKANHIDGIKPNKNIGEAAEKIRTTRLNTKQIR